MRLLSLNCCLEVFQVNILNSLIFSQSPQMAFHLVSCGFKQGLPGIRLLTGHIPVGMVSCHQHKRRKMDFFCIGAGYLPD